MKDDEIDRSLIDAARAELGPSRADRDRLRRAVTAAIAGGVAAGTAGVAGSSAAAQGALVSAAGWSAGKIAIVCTIALTTVGGAVAIVSVGGSDDEPRVADTERVTREPAREPAPVVAPAAAPAPPPIVAVEAPAPAPPAARAPAPREAAPIAVPAPSVAEPASIAESIRAETLLLRDAHAALRDHDPDRALRLLEEHAARFPEGTLVEERLATRVLALCDAGRVDRARDEGRRFLEEHPRSLQTPRVRGSCIADP